MLNPLIQFPAALAVAALLAVSSPAIARYETIYKGPLKGTAAGEKALGYSYKTRSLEDAKALSDEAVDIMAQLVVEATLGHYTRVTITAVGPAGSSQGVEQGFVVRPSGEWVDAKSLGEHAAMLAALTSAYSKLDAAFKAENEDAIHALTAKVFVHELASGSERTMDQDLALMKSELKTVISWKTAMNGIFIRGDRACVVATQDFTGEAYDAKHVLQKIKDTAKSLDTWVWIGQDAQLVRSKDLEEQMSAAQ